MKQGTCEIPGKNPGGSTLQSSFPFSQLECISGEYFREHVLKEQRSPLENTPTTPYKTWIESLPQHLSKTGQQIIASWWSFELLSGVFNCEAAHTKLFGADVDHTRRDHCIHAAYVARQVADRALINLSDHEKTVLELVMLLHDPHRLGSHELDRVIASIPGAPPIHDWGWGEDFHEYHGAQEVYRDTDLREILGEYWPDVLAVLSYPDTRSPDSPSRIKDFGPTPPVLPDGHRPLLGKERINLLYRLKDEIDRMSYTDLDFQRSGFDPSFIAGLQHCIQYYQEHLVTVGNHLAVLLPLHKAGTERDGIDALPFDLLIGARGLHRETIATSITSCLVGAVMRRALEKTLAQRASEPPPTNSPQGEAETSDCYKFVRNLALKGSYRELFGKTVLELLHAPHSAQDILGIEDGIAPLANFDRDALVESSARDALCAYVSTERSSEVCGFSRSNMTRFEYDLKKYLQSKGLDHEVYVLLSNDFEKVFEFKVVDGREHAERNDFLEGVGQDGDETSAELLDVFRLAVRTSPKSQQIVIAMKALDDSGHCRNLRPVQDAVREFVRSYGILKDPMALETGYNHRVFCEPLNFHLFRPSVQQRMKNFEPAWVTRGGCGLQLS